VASPNSIEPKPDPPGPVFAADIPACMIACSLLAAATVCAQDSGQTNMRETTGPLPPAPVLAPDPPANLRLRNTAIITAGALAVAAYGKANWYQDGFGGGFKTVDEGFFGENTPYGGADKLGHMFANYANVRVFTPLFQLAGNTRGDAIWLSALSTAAIFTAVEVADGFSRKWRFSAQDEAMNLAGAALGVIMETHPQLDEKFDFRLSYRKSANSSWQPFSDYSGQRYLLVAKADGFESLRNRPVLRYLELSLGYQARGFDELGAERRRDVYVGLSLNLSRLLADGVYQGRLSTTPVQRTAELVFELWQFPTAVYSSFKLD
jgi:hypothetical protein